LEAHVKEPNKNLPKYVYQVADAFGRIGVEMAPRAIYERIDSGERPYFPTLRKVLLPSMAKLGVLTQNKRTQKDGSVYVTYKFLGLHRAK
jgi:hypothetical protein